MRKGYSLQQLGKLEKHMQNNDNDSYPTLPGKINSKWIKDLNIRSDTMKLLEENVGKNLIDTSLGYKFWGVMPNGQTTKEKTTNGTSNSKTSAPQKKQLSKWKKQPTGWEKIFANHISDKGLISKLYKELTQFDNNNKKTLQFKNGQKN